MLDHVSDVYFVTGDSGSDKRLIEYLAGRPDERITSKVFLIARLFSDEHHLGLRVPLAEHGLRSAAPNIAATAARCGFRELLD